MAETNKSKLMSEAEIIEAINADSLVSVSLGAGQPQKNVKMSTLASVVAGYIGTFSQSNKGTLAASGTKTIEVLNRTFSFVAITSWNYYWIYAVFFSGSDSISGIELASNKRSDVEISFESNKVIAKNKSQTSEYRLDMFVLTCL